MLPSYWKLPPPPPVGSTCRFFKYLESPLLACQRFTFGMSTVHFWHVDGPFGMATEPIPLMTYGDKQIKKREREREEEVFERGGKKGKEGQEVVDAREKHVSFKEAGLKQGEKWIIVEWLMLS